MRSKSVVNVVSCHAEGEVGDVITGGVAPPPGDSLWEQSRFIAKDACLWNFVLNEPRGGVFRHVNLLVPAKDPRAEYGFIIMEPNDVPPMSGSNSICVATVLLDTGILPMAEPQTRFFLEAPGGVVEVTAYCKNGKAQRIKVENVPSFTDRLDATIEVEGIGTLVVDTAYGGDSFVLVDAAAIGFQITPDEAKDLVSVGMRITAAANEQLGFIHPENADWDHISFCQFMGKVENENGVLTSLNAVAIRPGKLDRSPCGTGTCARMATLYTRGNLRINQTFVAKSIIGSEFRGAIEREVAVADKRAIVPSITGRGWITGTNQLLLDPDDPWPKGYRLSDTWPCY